MPEQPSGCMTCGVHSTQKINDMSHDQLISDPSTYVKKRTQLSDDSILLRHMDDVVGTGPEEHLMTDFEHIKTSLHLTEVMVSHKEGDTVKFLGLEITKRSRGFELKYSTDLVEFLFNICVEHAVWNSQWTDHSRGTGGRAVGTHLSPCCFFRFKATVSQNFDLTWQDGVADRSFFF